jgi:hypothetical protein
MERKGFLIPVDLLSYPQHTTKITPQRLHRQDTWLLEKKQVDKIPQVTHQKVNHSALLVYQS